MATISIREATETEANQINWRPIRSRKPIVTHTPKKDVDNIVKDIIDKSEGGTVLAEIHGGRVYLDVFQLGQVLRPVADNLGIRLQTQQVSGDRHTNATIAIRRVGLNADSPFSRLQKYFGE